MQEKAAISHQRSACFADYWLLTACFLAVGVGFEPTDP